MKDENGEESALKQAVEDTKPTKDLKPEPYVMSGINLARFYENPDRAKAEAICLELESLLKEKDLYLNLMDCIKINSKTNKTI
ncbi:MAG: hypothetical protein IPL73_23630 [Candidatus Obscuribacter sp.]|nr:hypothetical protein [Candidatus Obscuribacter sp.]